MLEALKGIGAGEEHMQTFRERVWSALRKMNQEQKAPIRASDLSRVVGGDAGYQLEKLKTERRAVRLPAGGWLALERKA